LDFLENYRTAYNRKDISYIKKVFSDNALIITGTVLKEKSGSHNDYMGLNKEQVKYQLFTKKDYLKKLTRVFNRNEWITVGFDSISVVRHPKYPNIYGVNLLQKWNSKYYSDLGYLFLLVDFKREDAPEIWVRSWQEEKTITSNNEIIDLGNFDIVD
jgi:hypothetical protein